MLAVTLSWCFTSVPSVLNVMMVCVYKTLTDVICLLGASRSPVVENLAVAVRGKLLIRCASLSVSLKEYGAVIFVPSLH